MYQGQTAWVLEDVRAWQGRGLESVYSIVYFDALFVKSRQDGPVKIKAAYLALGVNMQGERRCWGYG
jgi:putative transposase